MASKTLTLNKLVSSDFSEGSSWVLNKGGGGDTDVGYFVFNSLGTTHPKISKVSFKINAIETGGNNIFSENIYLNFEFGTYSGTTFTKASTFSFGQQGVKESQNQVSITASASSSSGSENVFGDNLCVKLTITPQSNSIGSKIVMSGFSLSVTYEIATYQMKITVSPEGAGTVTGAGTYEAKEFVTIQAYPNEGYVFKGWQFSLSGNIFENNPATYQMNNDWDLIALFEKVFINNIPIDTTKPKKILIDKDVVKGVFIDKTKVYG